MPVMVFKNRSTLPLGLFFNIVKRNSILFNNYTSVGNIIFQ